MYVVYADSNLLYHPNLSDFGNDIYNTLLTIEDNKPKSFRFTLPVDNNLYNSITKMKTVIQVFQDDEEIFRGRVLDEDRDFNNNKVLYCEGELSYLYDSIVRPFVANNISIANFFGQLVTQHNSQVDSTKQFLVGTVDVSVNETLGLAIDGYSSTWQVINNYLIGPYGGHIRVRLENGNRYLDYIESYASVSDQVIRFGENLLDISQYTTAEKMMTRLIPLGATYTEEKDDSEIISGTELRTAESDMISPKNGSSSVQYQLELKVSIMAKNKSRKESQIKVELGLRAAIGTASWSGLSSSYIYGRILASGRQKQKTGVPSINLTDPQTYTNICTWTGWVKNDNITIKGEFVNKYSRKDIKPKTTAVGVSIDFYSYAQKTVYTTISSVNEGSDYLISTEADNLYGPIIKTNNWPDISDPALLMQKGIDYLTKNALLSINLDLNAIDLHLLNVDYNKIKMGDSVRVISVPHGIDETFTCDKMEIDIQDPESNTYSLGKDITNLTDKTVAGYSQSIIIGDKLEEVQSSLTETDNMVDMITEAVNEIYNSYSNIETQFDNLSVDYAEIDFANVDVAAIDVAFVNQATITDLNTRYATIDFANIGQAAIDSLSTHFATIDLANISQAAITNLSADFATIDLANISQAAITNLSADFATIDLANISQAAITNLSADFATIDLANISQAAITNLSTHFATIDLANIGQAAINNLSANFATIDLANISQAAITNLSADFATINLANINQGAFEKIFSNTLVADYAVLQDGTVTGSLKAVDISGDLITAGTIVADRLVISGPDGLYYQLNANGNGDLTPEQLSDPELQNALHGSNIVANSITANQIAAGTITSNEIAANTINARNIEANSITSVEIAAGTITGNEIASETITAENIKAGSISADRFNAEFTQKVEGMSEDIQSYKNSIIIDPEEKLISIVSGEDAMTMNLTSDSLAFILNQISRLAWLDAEEGLGAPEISIGPPDTLSGNRWVSNIGQRWRITVSDDGTRLRFSRHKGVTTE